MNALCLMFLAPALLASAEGAPKQTAKEQLQGEWRVTATEFDGRALSEDMLKDRQIVFAEDKFKVVVGGATRGTRTFALDPAKAPKHIDIGNPDKQEKSYGIYVLNKDELKLCYPEPGGERPTEFASPPGKRLYLITLKRGKS